MVKSYESSNGEYARNLEFASKEYSGNDQDTGSAVIIHVLLKHYVDPFRFSSSEHHLA